MRLRSKQEIYRVLEEVYRAISLKLNGSEYGFPVHIGGKHVWGVTGLFEEVNARLQKLGLESLSWDEFANLLDELRRDPAYYGKIYVTFHVAPNGRVEPHDIIFYRPVFIRKG